MSNATRPVLGLAVALLALVLSIFVSAGCDVTECGDGTIEIDGNCEPLQAANCTGPGVRFQNGRCVPDFDDVCGPGTIEDEDTGQCVSTGGPVPDPEPDVGGDTGADMGADAPVDVADGGGDAPVDLVDEEVVTFEPDCADDLDPGNRVCIWGQVTNFIDGSPVPGNADPALEVQVKDLLVALSNPTEVVDETLILPGGYFIMPGVDLSGPPQQLLLIAGEREEGLTLEGPGETWQRAITGLITTSASVDTYEEQPLFIIPRTAVAGWNSELGREAPLPTLETSGFLLARILDAETGTPLSGAELVYNGGAAVNIEYFSDVGLTTFGDTQTETGSSGVALLEGSSATDTCSATLAGFSSTGQVSCGVSPGRVSIVHILMLAD